MRADVTKFLTDELGMTAEQITAIAAHEAIFDGAADRITAFSQRQSQLAADRQALTEAQTAVNAANERLNAETIEWARLRAADEPISTQLAKDLEDARAESARTTERLRIVAQRAGLNPDEVAPMPATQTPPVTPPAVNLDGYVKDTDVQTRLGTMANYLLDMQPVLSEIQHEHGQLFAGTFLNTKPIIDELRRRAADRANTKPLDLRAIWEELNNVPAKRTEIATATQTAVLAAAEARGYERARTESTLPAGQQPTGHGHHSVVFTRPGADKSTLQRPMANNRISAAASALATHKYATRPGQTSPTPAAA